MCRHAVPGLANQHSDLHNCIWTYTHRLLDPKQGVCAFLPTGPTSQLGKMLTKLCQKWVLSDADSIPTSLEDAPLQPKDDDQSCGCFCICYLSCAACDQPLKNMFAAEDMVIVRQIVSHTLVGYVEDPKVLKRKRDKVCVYAYIYIN